jgi:imidazolonepropionase
MQPETVRAARHGVDRVQLAVELCATSADHCTHLSTLNIESLAGSQTVATLLPGAEFATRSRYPDARALLDTGARTDIGHLAPGARTDLAILDAPSHPHLAYRPGVPLVRTVLLAGEPRRAGNQPRLLAGAG